MLCDDFKCKELVGGVCSHYPEDYMKFVTRYGHCPFLGDGPRKVKKEQQGKVRQGQKKQKGKK